MVGLLVDTELVAGRDEAVGITTRYGWTARGSNSQRWEAFSAPFLTDPKSQTASCKMGAKSDFRG